MNEFDRYLEQNLRHMLDPVVAVQPPVRGGRLKRTRKPILVVKPVALEFVADAIPVAEAVAVTVSVAPFRQL
ncbi:MAG: hypothetical protein E6I27_14895 [Chloroflexi bacterium]|nr:MAG: hypothetical protein E6I96_01265 [Chloroflexota bacterium]TMF35724.1 MAG: hypothetical protein E6I27_14895 [Chloroflexota bacterium]